MRDGMKKGDRLNVWMNGRHVGVFTALKNSVGFEYDPDAPRISFSLPKDSSWRKDAPENSLLNLLPESGAAKYAMMQSIGAKSKEPFDLLDNVDSAGALVFSRSDEQPSLLSTSVAEATDSDIAARITAVRHSPDSWFFKRFGRGFSASCGRGGIAVMFFPSVFGCIV